MNDLFGKSYFVRLNDNLCWLNFGKTEVSFVGNGINTVLPYSYKEPFGEIVEVPFFTKDNKLVLVTNKIEVELYLPEAPPVPNPTPEPEQDELLDLSKVKWLHTNVSKWSVTANLKSVKVGPSTITLGYDKASVWPAENDVNANPWVFVNLDGIWHAATWEWLRPGQTTKNLIAVDGSHIKVPPLDTWHPVSGETYYFMVSGLARSTQRNVLERSNLLKVVWP